MYFLLKVRPFLGAMLVLGRVNTSIFSLETVIPFLKVLTFRQVHCIVQPSMDSFNPSCYAVFCGTFMNIQPKILRGHR